MSLHYTNDPSMKRPGYHYQELGDGTFIGSPDEIVETRAPWLWRVKAWIAAAIRALKDKP